MNNSLMVPFIMKNGVKYHCLIQGSAVTVPEGVTMIPWNAFSGCDKITSIHLPRSLQSVAPHTFRSWTALQEITADKGNPCFYAVDGLLLERTHTAAKLVACPMAKTEVHVPEGVTELVPGVFEQHMFLARVSLPDSLTVIEENAFARCGRLASVHIPKAVTKIGAGAFEECENLAEILVDTENRRYRSFDGMLFKNKDLVRCPGGKKGEALIPDGTKKIAKGAFRDCAHVTSVSIPDSVTSVGTEAFFGCRSLRRLVLPPEVTKLGPGVCRDCLQLEEAVFPEKLSEIGKYAFCSSGLRRVTLPAAMRIVATSAFRNCKELEELTIASDTVNIALEAFTGCALRRLTISGTPKLVPSAFTDCGPLETVTAEALSPAELPKGPLKDIALVTFARRLQAGETPPMREEYLNYIRNQRKKLAVLAVAHEELLHLMFQNHFFTNKEIQPLLEAAENNVPVRAEILDYQDQNGGPADPFEELDAEFSRAERVAAYVEKNGRLPISELKKIWGWKKLEDGTLCITSYKGSDTAITVPETIGKATVSTIGTSFLTRNAAARQSLASVTLPESVTCIERQAFSLCYGLEQINIPSGVTEIRDFTFQNCTSLKSIVLPDGVTEIGLYAFKFSGLKQITIPRSVTRIDTWAFIGCKKMAIRAPANSYADNFARMQNHKFIKMEE